MRFVSARHGDRRFAGAVIDDAVVPLDGVSELGPATPSSLLRAPALRRGEELPLADVELLPVVPNRGRSSAWARLRAHVGDGPGLPGYPVLFTKFAGSLVGPYATIVAPPTQQVGFEAEIAVVIGTAGRGSAAALGHVAGYAIVSDVSMRLPVPDDQWLQGKAWGLRRRSARARDTGRGPRRPRPASDPERRADAGVEHLAADLQRADDHRAHLRVHDARGRRPILTGTPDGVDYSDPQVFEDGDLVAVEVTGLAGSRPPRLNHGRSGREEGGDVRPGRASPCGRYGVRAAPEEEKTT